MRQQKPNSPMPELPIEDLTAIADGARLSGAMPYIELELDRVEASLRARVFGKIRDGDLSPEAAQAAWLELFSIDSLRRRLTSRVRVGISAGERLKPAMEGDTNDAEG